MELFKHGKTGLRDRFAVQYAVQKWDNSLGSPHSRWNLIAMCMEVGMSDEISFGRWLQRRRKALDLTQGELARRVGCAVETLRKIEADARRPSRQIAERLADALELPKAEGAAFVRTARGELTVDRLASPTQHVS